MPKSTQKVQVEPTPFDLAVISVIETLDGNQHLLQKGYKHFSHKQDLLDWLGLEINKWSNIKNHERHVPTRGKKTNKELIIDKLVRRFDVNRSFLETNTGPMFKTSIMLEEPEVHYKSRQQLEKELEEAEVKLKTARLRIKELEKLADQQAQVIAGKKVSQKVRQKPR
jgi:hypothetical protein